jgi:hypothetical protein
VPRPATGITALLTVCGARGIEVGSLTAPERSGCRVRDSCASRPASPTGSRAIPANPSQRRRWPSCRPAQARPPPSTFARRGGRPAAPRPKLVSEANSSTSMTSRTLRAAAGAAAEDDPAAGASSVTSPQAATWASARSDT